MNEKLYVLKKFGVPVELEILGHKEGLSFIAGHLTQSVIPDIDDIIGFVKEYIVSKTEGIEIDLNFIDIIASYGVKDSYISKLTAKAAGFVEEMEIFVKDFMNIYMVDGADDRYDIPEEFVGAIDYLEYRINNSDLASEEKTMLLTGVGILRASYDYWADIFTSESNAWKAWWTSVNYTVSDVRKYSANGDWIIASYNGAMEGCRSGEIYGLTGWGSVAGALFAAAICSIYPAPLQ